jgi:hypothetical protein
MVRAVGSSSVIPPGQFLEPSPCVTALARRRVDDPDRARARHGCRDGLGTLARRSGDDDAGRLGGGLCGHGGGYMWTPAVQAKLAGATALETIALPRQTVSIIDDDPGVLVAGSVHTVAAHPSRTGKRTRPRP